MDLHLFDHTGELVRAMGPIRGEDLKYRAHRRGLKVWFGSAKPNRLHYEAQLIPESFVSSHDLGPDEVALEVGFHAEQGNDQQNQAILDQLHQSEPTWRPALGTEAEAGPFLGNSHWTRLSEIWVESDLEDPELAFELASRLVDYIETVEPILSQAK